MAVDLDDQDGLWNLLTETFPSCPVPDRAAITDAVALYEGDLEDFFDAAWTQVANEMRPPADELYLLNHTGFAYYLPAALWWLSTEPQANLLEWFGKTLVVNLPDILDKQLWDSSQLALLKSTLEALTLKYTPDDLYPLEPGEDPADMDPAFDLKHAVKLLESFEST